MIDKQTNTRLKRFAQEARRYLIDQVNTKLSEVLAPDSDAATYEKTKPLYNALLREVTGGRSQVTGELKPETCNLKPIAERVAYTWFNRLTALRYMDLKRFNPVGIISPRAGDSLPQILSEAKMGIIDPLLINTEDRQRVLGLLSGTVESTYHKGDAQSEAYRILLLGACNSIGKSLPFLFKPIKDWMELLLPDDLLGEHGILAMIREVMTEESCQDVEVIGWLYQYYISEKKDEVFAQVKKGKKVQSHEIPAVTQLFTPHWIVKYMVQNSLGRLWLESHPKSSLKDKMEYYIADSQDSVDGLDSRFRGNDNKGITVYTPEEIKFCDPCCGSGHILTYAFDLLYDIYSEEGYDPIDIPRLIISKNLYGIEIDERARELAAFALSMKARDKDRQWFSRGIDPQICCLENIRFGKDELEPYLDRCGRDLFTYNFERMLSQFEHADTYGSLIVPYEQDIESIRGLLNAKDFSGDVFLAPTHKKVLKLIDQTDFLSTKYQVVVTNPPYMGKGMSDLLSKFLNDNYKDVKSDLFSAFVKRCSGLGIGAAHIGIMSPNVWMYISSYEKLRKWMITERTLTNLVELPLSGFTGATVQICAYNFMNQVKPEWMGAYVRLVGFKGADEEMSRCTIDAIANPDCGYFYRIASTEFKKIPGAPIAYWASDEELLIFDSCGTTSDFCYPRKGLDTGENDIFLRLWHEVENSKSTFSNTCNNKKWFPYNKGGEYRRWYGNREYLINWQNDGFEIKQNLSNKTKKPTIRNSSFYLREGYTWSTVSSGSFSVRYSPPGSLFDNGGCTIFADKDLHSIGSYLNSKVVQKLLMFIAPTLNYQAGDVGSLPYKDIIAENTALLLVDLSKSDWDSFETSWDFQRLPLIQVTDNRCQVSVKEAYLKLREQWIENTLKMQELEEKNNRIFIEAYGLQDELSPEVPLREITLTCNPYYRYGVNPEVLGVSGLGVREFPLNAELEKRLMADTMKELISYAVGCMFGRYSLDKPGLILANQGEGIEEYLEKVTGYRSQVSGEHSLTPDTCHLTPSFMPDKDNVIPILEGEWFVDDIVSRFSEFLKVAFGTDKYSENINFIEEAIGKDLRTYFLKDFYNDHVKRYKKRPIYWLFSSPKGSFNALIYMHRYTPDTVSILLNGYLREYIHKIRAKSQQLEHQLGAGSLNERDKMLTRKDIERLKDVLPELEAWEAKVILPLAEKRMEIDLDDGVKVNYLKFSSAVRSIPGLAAKEE